MTLLLVVLSVSHVLRGRSAWENLGHMRSHNYKGVWEMKSLAFQLSAWKGALHGGRRTE